MPQSFHFQLSSYAVVGGDAGLDQFNAEVFVVVVSLISSDRDRACCKSDGSCKRNYSILQLLIVFNLDLIL